jgi:hypothetical protein
VSTTFSPLETEILSASEPHPKNAEYKVAAGVEKWGEDDVAVTKVQMQYDGKAQGRKDPSYPTNGRDLACVTKATEAVQHRMLMKNSLKDTISQIRILPMSDKEFPAKYSIDAYFKGTATQPAEIVIHKGEYYYREYHAIASADNGSKLANEERILVLFHYNKELVACGEMTSQSDKGTKSKDFAGNWVEYKGHYKFALETVKLFQHPIDMVTFSQIVPEVTAVNQAAPFVPMKYLPEILRMALMAM